MMAIPKGKITQADVERSSAILSLLVICETAARVMDNMGEKEVIRISGALAHSLEYMQSLASDNLIAIEHALLSEVSA